MPIGSDMFRRLGQVLLISAICFVLGACNKENAPSFKTTDITGAEYGQDFRLLDPDQKERTLADFHGKVVMMFFGFTQCPDICPTALLRAAEIREMLGPDADRFQVIFVTVDPERDEPEVLKEYTTVFHPSFLGLYTTLEHTHEVAKAFRVFFRKVPTEGSYTIDHSATSYVYDPQGKLRLAVSYQSKAEDIADDIRTLLHNTP